MSDIEEADIALSCVDTHLQYDKYNRTFHLLDREFASTLEDGVEYELVVPLTVEALNEEDVADAVASLQEV